MDSEGATLSGLSDGRSFGLRDLPRDLPRDQYPLNLTCAFTDCQQLGIAGALLNWLVLNVSVSAVNLNTGVSDLDRDFAGEELGHRRAERKRFAAVLSPRCPVGEKPRGVDLGGGIGELALDRLKRRDRLAECHPLGRVV